MATLQISLDTLEWAANLAGRTIEALAEEVAPKSKREAFMSGEMTAKQAEKVAAFASVPFGLLFLPKPPERIDPEIPDLRQTPHPEPLSRDFFAVLRDILKKADWYSDYVRELGADRNPYVGRFPFSAQLDSDEVAYDIAKLLAITDEDRKEARTYELFYSLLVDRVEALGVLVFKSGIVGASTRRGLSVEEFRGFAIADDFAPVIFINGKDWDAAWAFTLIHELAHIWVGCGGVSDSTVGINAEDAELEWFCNRVAAEVLVPKKRFLELWNEHRESPVESLSSRFRVSRLVIARRAVDCRLLTWDQYNNIAAERPRQRTDSGGDPYRTIPVRNSKKFTRALLTQAMYGKTMLRDAASMLHVKPDTIVELAKRALQRGG